MQTQTTRIGYSLRLPADLKKWIEETARENDRSVNMEIIRLIKAAKNSNEEQA